ncbi:MAG: aromatic amino acid transport family protein [Cyanobacteria bacterium P01_A01_bin.84]
MKTVIPTHLFSNVELEERKSTHTHNSGSVLGSTALVAGTTVGAGILALPAVTVGAGIIPSTILLLGVWLYALISALLIAELALAKMQIEGRANVGFIGMVESYLGKTGGRIAGAAYLFFHYALLIAYLSEGGEILLGAISNAAFRFLHIPSDLPKYLGSTIFALIMGGILCVGRDKFVERLNSVMVGIVLVSFAGLLILAGEQVQISNLLIQNWKALPVAVPVMLVALFYHNIVPVITTQLEGDGKKIRQSIIVGSAIPLVMFFAWNAVILGSFNITSIVDNSFDPLEILRSGSFGKLLGVFISVFSEFAIATSFIGFVYGLLDFFRDLNQDWNLLPSDKNSRLPFISLALIPPMGLSALNPDIFLAALDYAGTYSTSILGGILPAVMSWKQREEYKEEHKQQQTTQRLVPGGKVTLVVLILVSLSIILRQVVLMII